MRKLLPTLLLLLCSVGVLVAQTPKQRIVVTDLTRIKQVGNIQLAPNGQRAVYTLTTIEPNPDQKEEYEYKSHIYLTDLKAGSAPKALTRGSESARQPVWSPNGKSIVFARTAKGKSQLFVMPLDGGEAYQLTTGKYGASNPIWSPDGTKILFTAGLTMTELLADSTLNPGKRTPSWSMEKPGFATNTFLQPDKKVKPNPDGSLAEIRAYLAKDVEDKKAKVVNRLTFQGEATTEPEMSFTHVFVVDAREGAAPRPLTRGFYSFQATNWLPDGKQILAVTDRDTLKHPDREQDNAIVAIAADGSGRVTTVLSEAGRSYSGPELSPDGKRLALLVNKSEGVSFPQLALTTLTGVKAGAVEMIPFDRSAGNLTWSTGASSDKKVGTAVLYFTASSNGGSPLYRLVPATKQVEQLTDFNSGVSSFHVIDNQIVFARIEVANPSELYRADGMAKNAVKLTNHNDWIAAKTLSFPEKRTYKNSKGQVVDYWIMKPVGLGSGAAGKKYPLLVNMHGGPTAMWGPGEGSTWHEHQYFCAQGYGVVYANPRGSGGYGQAFQAANYQDWGTGPTEDVLAAATDAAKEVWVDTSRQVLTGGSYAGYLTAWIVGHDNRFKAAFAQRGVYDLTTFMGEANAWRLVPNYFGGYPWQPEIQKVLDANSPYSFVANIKTPLLIKHGENDLRTGVVQSEMLYKSLKLLGRPVEYVRMPGATHELSRTGNVRQRIDRMLRMYEFFERYVGPDVQGLTQK